MKNYKELLSELPSKSVVFTCGKFNPPNVGHELEIKVVRKLASQRKADHFVFVSSANDAKKNPLEISKKLQYLGSLFPNTKFVHKEIDAIGTILKKYKSVTLVTPADSVDYYKKALKRVGITDVEVVKAGTTCPDEDDKLIKLASKGDYSQFKTNLPTTIRELDGKRLMNDVRIGLDLEPIKEQINLVKDNLREQYFRGEIFNEGAIVESDNVVYKIIKRGSNHLLLQCEDGSKVSKWIQDVQLTEREFMLDEKLIQEADATSATGLSGGNKEAKKAQADTAKMKLALDQAKEKEDLAKQQERERANLKNMAEGKDSPIVDTNKKYNIAKSIMSLSDFRKSTNQGTKDEKSIETKIDDALDGKAEPIAQPSLTLRHQKIRHHLGEETDEQSDSRDGQLKRFKKQAKDSKLTEEQFDDINEEELFQQVQYDLDTLSEEEFYEAYDDEELAIIDDETGEEIDTVDSIAEEALMEVLSRIERIRAKARMRRSQTKRMRREKIALRQLSTPQVANKRARRMAISAMKKRLLKGRNPQKVSVGEKERVERFIAQRRKIVDRLSARMVSRVKQVEKARMSHKKFTKPNNGVSF